MDKSELETHIKSLKSMKSFDSSGNFASKTYSQTSEPINHSLGNSSRLQVNGNIENDITESSSLTTYERYKVSINDRIRELFLELNILECQLVPILDLNNSGCSNVSSEKGCEKKCDLEDILCEKKCDLEDFLSTVNKELNNLKGKIMEINNRSIL